MPYDIVQNICIRHLLKCILMQILFNNKNFVKKIILRSRLVLHHSRKIKYEIFKQGNNTVGVGKYIFYYGCP